MLMKRPHGDKDCQPYNRAKNERKEEIVPRREAPKGATASIEFICGNEGRAAAHVTSQGQYLVKDNSEMPSRSAKVISDA